MKLLKYKIAALFLIGALSHGFTQERDEISVIGSTEYKIEPIYKVAMVISLANVYYDVDNYTLEDLKSKLLEKVESANVSYDKMEEDALAYAFLGYERDGTILRFTLSSLDEVKKLLGVQSLGTRPQETVQEFKLSDKEMAEYGKLAFEDAKNRASQLAAQIGRSIGKATKISDNNYQDYRESIYYTGINNTKIYSISVSFELK